MTRIDELDIVVRQQGGQFLAGLPQLGLFAKGADVSSALAALNIKKQALLADLDAAGAADMLDFGDRRTGVEHASSFTPAGEFRRFAVKTGIVVSFVAVATVVSGVLLASVVNNSVKTTINRVMEIKMGGTPFWNNVERQIERMADPESDLPVEKKEKLIANIRAISEKWAPVAAEIRSALALADKAEKRDDTRAR